MTRTETARMRVLATLMYHWRFDDGNSWRSFDELAEYTGCNRRTVVRVVRDLAWRGVLRLSSMFDYEGRIVGSGYFFTAAADRAIHRGETLEGIRFLARDEFEPTQPDLEVE